MEWPLYWINKEFYKSGNYQLKLSGIVVVVTYVKTWREYNVVLLNGSFVVLHYIYQNIFKLSLKYCTEVVQLKEVRNYIQCKINSLGYFSRYFNIVLLFHMYRRKRKKAREKNELNSTRIKLDILPLPGMNFRSPLMLPFL